MAGARLDSAKVWPSFNWEKASVLRFEDRQHIFFEGEERLYLYLVESGSICLYKTLPEGKRHIFGFSFTVNSSAIPREHD